MDPTGELEQCEKFEKCEKFTSLPGEHHCEKFSQRPTMDTARLIPRPNTSKYFGLPIESIAVSYHSILYT